MTTVLLVRHGESEANRNEIFAGQLDAPLQNKGVEQAKLTAKFIKENYNVDKVYAKMYTHSSKGGTSYMGHIKFHDTDNGLKMVVDLKDLRPGVPYNMKLYKCGMCANDETGCCNKSAIYVGLPMIETGMSRKVNQTYMIQGVSAAQLNGAKIYLERDGGYKAGWGTLEK